MLSNSLSDEAKAGNDCFATIDKIRAHDSMVPGVYCDFSAITSAKEVIVKIPLRIPISYFLMLFNMRYYPNWSGKLSIELMPSYQNIVIAPVCDHESLVAAKAVVEGDYLCDLGFRNVNESVKSNIKATAGSGSTTYATMDAPQKFVCNSQITKDVKIKLATYLLKMDVFNALAAKYIQVPMLFPIHVCQVRDFTQPLGSNSTSAPTSFNTAATIGLKHCDTMFTVFRQSQYSRTCFLNPQIRYSFNIDGKIYPREAYETVDDPRNLNMLLDAVNLNGSLLSSLAKDIKTSVQPYYYKNTYNASGVNTKTRAWHGKDNSNFFIGLPFAEGEDFMGGISTTGTVQIELFGDRLANTAMKNVTYIAPTGIYFEDALLKVRAMKPDGRSQIEITNASIEQLVAGMAR
ncbi:hypothetical protein GPJ56_005429 [Histomonas meleagridis]|nr:hypothetical protein GPJ56_005429 [Histomonas meleagridis]